MNTAGSTTSAAGSASPRADSLGARDVGPRQERVLAVWMAVAWIALAVRGGMWGGGSLPWQPPGLVNIDQVEARPLAFRLDVNQAPWQELVLLPRIGETLARRITDSRDREGPFRGPEDLLRVRGIGPKTLEQLRPFLGDPFPSKGQQHRGVPTS